MKIEHWSIVSRSTCTASKNETQITTTTEIQITTTDNIDTKKFMDYIQAYNDASEQKSDE